jgi:hypothetical protein
MKGRRRPTRRKPSRQPRKRLPPTSTDKPPPLDWMTEQSTPPRLRASHPALISSGIVQPPSPPNPVPDPVGNPEGPLPLRAQTPVQLRAADVAAPAPVLEVLPHFSVNEPTPNPQQYQEMLSRIEVFETLIAELPNQQRRIGHNIRPITDEDVQEITKAVAILKAQLGMETPKRARRRKPKSAKADLTPPLEVVLKLEVVPKKAKAAESTLRKIGERLGTYLDTFLLEASKSGGKEAGKEGVKLLLKRLPYWLALYFALMNIANYVASIFLK